MSEGLIGLLLDDRIDGVLDLGLQRVLVDVLRDGHDGDSAASVVLHAGGAAETLRMQGKPAAGRHGGGWKTRAKGRR